MARHRIGLNLVTLRGGQDAAGLEDNLDRLRRAGFDGVGLWVRTVEQWLDSGRTIAQLGRAIGDRGLEVHELCFVGVLDDSGDVADRSREFGWAAELGAGAVISIYGRPDSPLAKARDDWAAFVAKVAGAGVPAAFEFIGPWPRYNSPLSAWEVVGAGPELGTIVFDTFHFWRGGCDLGQLEQVPARRVSLVHLNDANDVPREKAVDADRTFPGEGVLPLGAMLGGLLAGGFTGPFSVEIFGRAQEQDPEAVAARAHETAAAVLGSL